MEAINITNAPKTGTFQMRINPTVKREVEDICASCGLTLEEACVRFLEATVACGDLPFPYTQQDIEEAKSIGVKMI